MKELQANLVVMVACYLYIIAIILIAGWLKRGVLGAKSSRKFPHSMIGNLPLIMPFFTQRIFPFLVASPFILIAFLVTPYSPFPWLAQKLSNLTDITKEGHQTGLVLYAISYTALAYFFSTRPYIVAAGIFPMAYGDSIAALVGMRYGKLMIGSKSFEGCLGMFLDSLISLLLVMLYFSPIYQFNIIDQVTPILAVSFVVTFVELISPGGLDNATVPVFGALTFLIAGGGA
ncbi:diacylglycerol/polyprenol kinase family protein [Thermoproteota archaeon]